MNKYDLEHACTAHPKMSKAEWEQTYALAWERYYTRPHMETILRRAMATRISPGKMMLYLIWFWGAVTLEKVHPLQAGYGRRKVRTDRRPGLPIESRWSFYPRESWAFVSKHVRLAGLVVQLSALRWRLKRDPAARQYMDEALTPVRDDDMDVLEMFSVTEAARGAAAKAKRDAAAKTVGAPAL